MAKASALLVGPAIFGAAVQAVAFLGARATVSVDVPPDSQNPVPTAPPSVGVGELLRKRDESFEALLAPDNTCGYVSGLANAAYTCGGQNVRCVLVTVSNAPGLVGCCNSQDCGFRTACLDLSAISSASRCDNKCALDTAVEKCTQSSAPFCNTIEFQGGMFDFFCNSLNTSTVLQAQTTFSGGPARTYTPLTSSSTISIPTTGTSQSTGPTSSSDSNGGGGGGGGSSANVGAIVGGVVGGLAVLGLIALALVFLLRKKKPEATPSDPAQMAQQQQGPHSLYGQPQPGGPGASTPGFPPQDPSKLPPHGSPPPGGYGSPPVQQHAYYPPPQGTQPGSPVSQMTSAYDRTSSVPGAMDNRVSQMSFTAYQPPQPSPQHQPTIHEAGGTAIDNHRGEMHELG